MTENDETLVLYSRLAFYPVHALALEEIVRRYRVRAVVLAGDPPEMPSVHRALGSTELGRDTNLSIGVEHMPRGARAARVSWLARRLQAARPDAIWVQEEPIDPFLLEILALYRLRRRPRIVTAVCENIFPPPGRPIALLRKALWPRLDGLLTVAPPSERGIRAAGMPRSVPATPFVVGGLEPEADVTSLPLPGEWARDDFVAGYAGRIVSEKGWHLLVEALGQLPASFRLAVAGDGTEVDRLRELAASPALSGRIHYAGLLPKGDLWRFYRAVDCLVVPSLTTPRWKEQVGSVIVDAMALGLPVIGSSSGAIPDIVGNGGVIVPEGDAAAIAGALRRLRDERGLASRLGAQGLRRYREEFSIPAYAGKIAGALGLRPRSVALAE